MKSAAVAAHGKDVWYVAATPLDKHVSTLAGSSAPSSPRNAAQACCTRISVSTRAMSIKNSTRLEMKLKDWDAILIEIDVDRADRFFVAAVVE
jgi:hypothetical protein